MINQNGKHKTLSGLITYNARSFRGALPSLYFTRGAKPLSMTRTVQGYLDYRDGHRIDFPTRKLNNLIRKNIYLCQNIVFLPLHWLTCASNNSETEGLLFLKLIYFYYSRTWGLRNIFFVFLVFYKREVTKIIISNRYTSSMAHVQFFHFTE